jgi:hypothetical protein
MNDINTIRKALKSIANVRAGVGTMRGLILVFLKDSENESHAEAVKLTGAKIIHRGYYVIGNL